MNLLEFHIKYNYYIDIKKTKRGCSVYYPSNFLLEEPMHAKVAEYQILPQGVKYREVESPDWTKIKLEDYVKRLFVTTDIILNMGYRCITKNLVMLNDKPINELNIPHVLPPPIRKEDLQREEQLGSIYFDMFTNSVDEASAQSLGVLRGYRAIKKLIDDGGIC